ncbi:casein kinase II beta subunit [Gonapodya prolifera JEL478]|uniref:Casein kinase II subunit beta n=1 Tax=Gonapodya prolifera (strain JEL478) TaxID=1344416 RepID=A0A139A884_GONPJ|nr:casein kinase II beta subunit [Gonapodya prolifera JEL478]|eukprot:KXS12593.1 casein kinase II beta subunit [Gonapodya prolifera JEL478]
MPRPAHTEEELRPEDENVTEQEEDEEEERRNGEGDAEQDDQDEFEEEDVEEEEELQDDDEDFSTDTYETSGNSNSSSDVSWINWFCTLSGNEYFLEVPEDFIEDDFNLCGLNAIVPHYNEALDTILDLDLDEGSGDATDQRPPSPPLPEALGRSVSLSPTPHPTNVSSTRRSRPTPTEIDQSASLLYSLVHARYLLTKGGLASMAERFAAGDFGTCPRVMCRGQLVVPMGLYDMPKLDNLRYFCPRCGDLYSPRDKRYQKVDGAAFGPTFPHLLFLTYPELVPAQSIILPESARKASPALQLPSDSLRPGVTPSSSSTTLYGVGVHTVQGSDSDSGPGRGPEQRRDGPQSSIGGGANVAAGSVEPDMQMYTPKVFGFRLSELARTGPRMGWLRERGDDLEVAHAESAEVNGSRALTGGQRTHTRKVVGGSARDEE